MRSPGACLLPGGKARDAMALLSHFVVICAAIASTFAAGPSDDGSPVSPPAANSPARVDAPIKDEPQVPEAAQDPEAREIDPAVDSLLTTLETAAADLRDFSAKLRYDKWDPVTNRWEIRAGELLYEVKPGGAKRFAMLFDTYIVGNRKQTRKTTYVYDAGWLAEIDYESKQFIKRQIVAPGKEFDPFKLGEGPFPLPVGQARSEVLQRFDVSLIGPPEDDQLKDLQNVDGLRLVPRPGMPEAKEFERVDVFYDKDTHLPVGISLIETDEAPNDGVDLREKKIVRLRDVKRNEGIDGSKLDIAEPDPNEWAISIEPWRGEGR